VTQAASVVTAMRRSEIVELTSPIGPNTVDRKPQPSARPHRPSLAETTRQIGYVGRRRRRHRGRRHIRYRNLCRRLPWRIGELASPGGAWQPLSPDPQTPPVDSQHHRSWSSTSSVVYWGGWLFMQKSYAPMSHAVLLPPLLGRQRQCWGSRHRWWSIRLRLRPRRRGSKAVVVFRGR
jgi:hypothetical protein